jgi:hypothetical protein
MKRIIKNILLAAFVVFTSTSCTKWLDVKPASQVTEDEQFSNEQGFYDALYGVYVELGNTSHYGSRASFYDLDILSQYYRFGTSNSFKDNELANYNYTTARGKLLSEDIWEKAYSEIANLNNLLRMIDEKGESFFSGDNHHLIKGEALALRAYLHFDIYRTYAPNVKVNSSFNLPYNTSLSITAARGITSSEFIEKTIEDLNEALNLIKDVDPIIDNPGEKFSTDENNYFRVNYFNYYAINALFARIYSNIGDNTKALEYAKLIIDSDVFNFVTLNDVTISGDLLFTDEVIFGIYQQKLNTIQKGFFNPFENTSKLILSRDDLNYIFEGNVDDIRNKLFADYFGSENAVLIKYANKNSVDDELAANDRYNPMIPAIKLSEMYLIAATSSDMINKATYINSLRNSRLIPHLAVDASEEELNLAILQEYRKEMLGDGQLFYYYKKMNIVPILGDFDFDSWNDVNFIVPIPDSELELGNL